jgi:hypothetical protein
MHPVINVHRNLVERVSSEYSGAVSDGSLYISRTTQDTRQESGYRLDYLPFFEGIALTGAIVLFGLARKMRK